MVPRYSITVEVGTVPVSVDTVLGAGTGTIGTGFGINFKSYKLFPHLHKYWYRYRVPVPYRNNKEPRSEWNRHFKEQMNWIRIKLKYKKKKYYRYVLTPHKS